VIAIVTPSGSADERAATWLSFQIQDTLVASGVSAKQIDFRVYRAGPGERSAPVRIAYSAISAHTAPCGSWPDQVGNTEKNGNYYDFGCATQQNLAAIVDNPLDLLYPRGMSPSDTARRSQVLDLYRKGAIFQGDYSREPGGEAAVGVGSP